MAVVRSEAELQKALAIVDREKKDERIRTDATKRFIDDVQSSLIYSLNWSEYLSAAPMAISLMGACYAASTIPDATAVMLTPPADGFQFLKWTSLNANLIQCSDMGRDAFTQAEVNMGNIAQISKNMFEIVGDIITALGDREAAMELKFSVESLKRNVVRCQTSINEIENSFDSWLAHVCELHQACVQEENKTQNMIRDNEAQLKAKQARLDGTKEALHTTEDAMKRMAKSLDIAEEAFKKAADNFPNGWELVGMQFVASFADTVTSAVGQGMLASMGGSGVALQAMNIFSKSQNEGTDITARSAPGPGNTLAIPNIDDPAFVHASQAIDAIRTLSKTLTGNKGGVDWDDILSSQKNGLGLVVAMFEHIKGNFQSSGEAPSLRLEKILDTCGTIIKSIEELSKELRDAGRSAPDANSPQVIQWQAQALAAYEAALQLKSEQKATPGIPASDTPLVNPGDAVEGQGKSGSIAENYLAAAEERYNLSQALYDNAQDRFLKSSESYKEVQLQIAAIMEELALLDAQKVSFETIKQILVKSIETLSLLKTEISKLARFFLAVGQLIDYVAETQVIEFVKYLEAVFLSGDDGPSISGFTFTDLRRQMIFTFTLMTRCYFTIFRGIAMMYTTVSKDFIFPGIELLEALSVEASSNSAQDALNKKLADLNKFTKNAEVGVKAIVKEKQDQIMGSMEVVASEIARKTQLLPAAPAQKRAIETGTKVVAEVVTDNIQKNKSSVVGKPFSSTASLVPSDDD